MRALVVPGCLILVGCGLGEGRFERVGFARWCAQAANCDDAVQVDACAARLRDQDRTGCSYDPVSAELCFDALQSVTCLANGADGAVVDVPVDCDSVWTCGGDE